MEESPENAGSATSPLLRVILLGGRWTGKSVSANTIVRREAFESGRIRTSQPEVRHEVVEGRELIVVDVPGWSNSVSFQEIPEGDKQRFKLNPSMCPPGPHAFLLAIPVDLSFTVEQKKTIEDHMKLLGDQVWKYTVVLFTYGDFLGEKTIEQFIESEGEALAWVIQKCRNRYHVFNNKEKSDSSQVSSLLEKLDDIVRYNNNSHYKLDEQTLKIIEMRQQEVAERAEERWRWAEEKRTQIKALISEKQMTPLSTLRMVLLGSRSAGKTSVLNTMLGFKEREDGKRTAHSEVHQGMVSETEIIVVDTPGWWKGFSTSDTPEAIKDELMSSVFLCLPGPHIFLLVIDADASFNARHRHAVKTHLELFGDEVWKHTIVIFTRGDWLGSRTIEQYIQGEGEALQSLVDRCGNRYHVLNNKKASDGTQITELMEKIQETVAENDWNHFAPEEQVFDKIEDRRRRVEVEAFRRQSQVKAKRRNLRAVWNKLREVKIVLLGQKTFGKTTTGNNILHKDGFASRHNDQCQVEVANVSGRLVTVIDTPGWWKDSFQATKEEDKEIVRGLSLSPSGVHAVLLVVPLDLKFRESHQVTLEEYINLFDSSIWKHTIVLFTYGDKLADKSVEEHIEREGDALRWLVDKCENRYHVINNLKKHDLTQITELFEKIDEMFAGNNKRLFCPNMKDVHLRVEEKSRRRLLKNVLKQQVDQEVTGRELMRLRAFKEVLLDLQAHAKESLTGTKPKLLIGEKPKIKTKSFGPKKKEGKEEKLDTRFNQEIEKLNKEIVKLSQFLSSSKEFLPPDMKSSSAESVFGSENRLDRLLDWFSNQQTSEDNQRTLDFSQTSGYRSILEKNFSFQESQEEDFQ